MILITFIIPKIPFITLIIVKYVQYNALNPSMVRPSDYPEVIPEHA